MELTCQTYVNKNAKIDRSKNLKTSRNKKA
jgi:hypothetical protein